jgi:inosine-uridine nucleoside N-ribohydrolase
VLSDFRLILITLLADDWSKGALWPAPREIAGHDALSESSPVPRKLILDVDPGIDDAVALAIALFDPRLDVLAVTATGGNVDPTQATSNARTIVSLLDPPRLPRIGVASNDVLLPDRGPSVHGADGLGGADLPLARLHGGHPAEKVILETVRSHPGEVTILALGPLTNLARLFAREPSVAELVGEVVVSGGTAFGRGSSTPVSDYNFFANPAAARHVIREPLTKTLVPLETTSQVVMGFDLLEQMPDESSRAGAMLHRILPHAFRAHRQLLGTEGICLHDVVTLVSLLHPELFERTTVGADVETSGELTMGMLVVDRRPVNRWQRNVDLLVDVEVGAVRDCILRGLDQAARSTLM